MKKRQKQTLVRIAVTFVLFVPLAVLLHTGTFDRLPRYLPLLAFLALYLLIAYDIIRKAARNILHGVVFDENLLMVVATAAAFAIGEYPEAIAVMLFYQVGELFQKLAVGRSRNSITSLMHLVPQVAHLETDGVIADADPEDVAVGDVLEVRPGERVPLDGVVLAGTSSLNTAALTGESMPQDVEPGNAIRNGCINGSGTLRMQVTKTFENSTVAQILELVENASSKKAKTEHFITRFAKVYTPAVTLAALLLFLIPVLCGGFWQDWLRRACTFLVISCPCALVISVPLGFFGGIGAGAKAGVLIKGGTDLEAAAKLSTLVFDKTGTLTCGDFRVSALHPQNCDEETLLQLAAAAERGSNHPIAKSILERCPVLPDSFSVQQMQEYPGHGIAAELDGKQLLVGNEKLLRRFSLAPEFRDEAATVVYVAYDGVYRGAICITDTIKSGAKEALDTLRKRGIDRMAMLTGDREAVGESVGRELGLDEVHAALLPKEKLEQLEMLLSSKRGNTTLGYVGDGINDAPVLARADVGIAMGAAGADAAKEEASVVILHDDLSKLSDLLRIAKKTVRIVKENVVFALFVKALVLVLGAFGFASMWMAVFADVGVSVLAILNAMRTLKTK